MDAELLKSMFLQACDRYERAVKWAFIGVLLLLVFHLMVFSQFVRFGKQLSSVQAKMIQLSTVAPIMAQLKSSLDAFEGRPREALKTQIEDMLTELRDAFKALDRSVAAIQTPMTAQFTAAAATLPPREERRPNLAIQMPPVEVQTQSPFEFDEPLRSRIRGANTLDELRSVLVPLIEDRIIRPRFDRLHGHWHDTVLPDMHQRAAALLKTVQESRPLFPEGEALWEEIQQRIDKTVSVAAAFAFRPPTDPNWWRSVAGKQTTLADIERAAASHFAQLSASQAIMQLDAQLKAALDQQKKLQERVEAELARIRESFTQQQSKLATLGKPFEVLSLDINVVVARFPLLLGIGLAALTIWPARRLLELAWMVDLIAKRSQERVPWEWFIGQAWFSRIGPRGGGAGEPWRRRTWCGRRPWLLGSLALGLLCWGWIGLAEWTLSGWGDLDPVYSALFAVGGGIAVAAAQIYRGYVARQVLVLRDTIGPPSEMQPAGSA